MNKRMKKFRKIRKIINKELRNHKRRQKVRMKREIKYLSKQIEMERIAKSAYANGWNDCKKAILNHISECPEIIN